MMGPTSHSAKFVCYETDGTEKGNSWQKWRGQRDGGGGSGDVKWRDGEQTSRVQTSMSRSMFSLS
jgi:hypothetical protein